MKKKRKRTDNFILFLFIITFAVISTFFYAVLFYIPDQISRHLGQPDENLDDSQRIVYSLFLFFHRQALQESSSYDPEEKLFTIHLGETAQGISKQLKMVNLISDDRVFNIYLKYKGIDRRIQAGVYLFDPQLTPIQIAEIIHDNDPQKVRFSFLPGWRVEEVAALIPNSGLDFSEEEFLTIVYSPPGSLTEEINIKPNHLEGLLFAGSYNFHREIGPEEMIGEMVRTFFSNLPENYEGKIKEKDLTIYEAITLASIIQKEAVVKEEAPLIASVFLNRLEAKMPLQSDPTVQYALGFIDDQNSWWKNPLSADDLQINSPFNTYNNTGIPPRPICNPGMDALLAIAYPATTDFYFFRSACDGSGLHVFSRTYEEHLQAACIQ